MTAYAAHAAGNAYVAETVMSAPREELPLLLFDGALRFLGRAEAAADDPSALGTWIARVQAILDELTASLDFERGGEIATNLRDIYVFINGHLASALVGRDATKIAQATELLREIRNAYEHALRAAR